jgi:hypothetical protein
MNSVYVYGFIGTTTTNYLWSDGRLQRFQDFRLGDNLSKLA